MIIFIPLLSQYDLNNVYCDVIIMYHVYSHIEFLFFSESIKVEILKTVTSLMPHYYGNDCLSVWCLAYLTCRMLIFYNSR